MYTNAPVYVDTFIGPPTLPNPHVFICGTSGGGKSVALKTLQQVAVLFLLMLKENIPTLLECLEEKL